MKKAENQTKIPKRQQLMNEGVVINSDVITRDMLEALRQGDESVFERIYLKHSHRITDFISSIIKSFEDAEEISQEVFTYLWTNRQKVDPDKDISAYLYILARFGIFNYFRSKKVHEAYVREAKYVNTDEAAATDELMYAKEIKIMVELAVDRMPEQRRKIYRMSRSEGINNDEIARKLGITKNTVEKHLTFALKDIREILALFVIVFMGK